MFFVTPDDLRSEIGADHQNEIHVDLTTNDEPGGRVEVQHNCRVPFACRGRPDLAHELALYEFLHQTGDRCLIKTCCLCQAGA